MKTIKANRKSYQNGLLIVIMVSIMLFSNGAVAQESRPVNSLFGSDVTVSELWVPEMKFNSIQGSIGTLIGFYGGALLNNSFLLGISGGVNLGHPRVNYGYFGGVGQFIIKSTGLIHCSGQVLVAYGTTKDYEDPKEGLLDNFWNISGAGFFMMEPGINLELNLSKGLTLVGGVSYRYVSGLDENNENVAITHVTNRQLSGINFNIGVKIAKQKK